MRMIVAAAALVGAASGASGAAAAGDYGVALRRMVSEAAQGRCPADLMAEPLLSACRDQMAVMRPELAALGPVAAVSFIKAEVHDDARVETWAVNYAAGKTTIWSIGNRKDGKFTTAYTLGQ